MEIHRQQCQGCGTFETRNILVREPNKPTTVYVRCCKCGQLVARYILSDYYHHGKGVESFLKSQGSSAAESGRDILGEFKSIEKQSLTGYLDALKYLESRDKPV